MKAPVALLALLIFCLGNPLAARAMVLPNKAASDQALLESFRKRVLPPKGLEMQQVFGGPEAPESTHVLFREPQEALNWATQVSPRLALSMGAKRFNVLPLSDPRYPLLQAQVRDLWLGFVELFPEQTKGLSEPPVVLVDSDVANAFVPKHLIEENKIAHTVVVLTSLLDVAGGADKRELLTGVFAHELAHSVFRHALEAYQQPINRFYDSNVYSLGYQAVRDTSLDANLDKWRNGATMVGDLTHAELRDLPSQGLAKPISLRVWNQLSEDLYDTSPACWAARDTFDVWAGYQRVSGFTSSFSIRSVDLPALSLTSEELINNSRSCLGNRRVGFIDLVSKAVGIPADALRQMPDLAAMAQNFDSAPDSIGGFQQLVAPIRGEMVAVETQVQFEKLGYFTYEEHADDISLLIHRYLGWNADSLANFFRLFMPKADVQRCDSILASGKMPASGSFSDAHRSTCYRIAHLGALNEMASKEDIKQFAAEYVKATTGQ